MYILAWLEEDIRTGTRTMDGSTKKRQQSNDEINRYLTNPCGRSSEDVQE